MKVSLILAVMFLAILIFESCNQSKTDQSYSPTSISSNSDSTVFVAKKGKGVGRKDSVSNVIPLVPYFGEGARWTDSFWDFNKYLPEDSHKGKYLMLVGGSSFVLIGGYDLATLYNKYCFRRAVVGDWEVGTYTAAGFDESQLLISIGYHNNGTYVMNSNWQNDVSTYRGTVHNAVFGFAQAYRPPKGL